MIKRLSALAAVGVLASSLSAGAATFTYNFLEESNSGKAIGESIFDSFDTTLVFTGPQLTVTAKAGSTPAFVYFDNGNAGMGVCKKVLDPSKLNVLTKGSANQCDPGSDDGLTATNEVLNFLAGVSGAIIESITVNSNHDKDNVLDSEWSINGTTYDADVDGIIDTGAPGGTSVKFDLGFKLDGGTAFDLFSTVAPNSYISSITVSTVPLPASVLLLGAGLGGLVLTRRRKTA